MNSSLKWEQVSTGRTGGGMKLSPLESAEYSARPCITYVQFEAIEVMLAKVDSARFRVVQTKESGCLAECMGGF